MEKRPNRYGYLQPEYGCASSNHNVTACGAANNKLQLLRRYRAPWLVAAEASHNRGAHLREAAGRLIGTGLHVATLGLRCSETPDQLDDFVIVEPLGNQLLRVIGVAGEDVQPVTLIRQDYVSTQLGGLCAA
jgi:hypothetical protein